MDELSGKKERQRDCEEEEKGKEEQRNKGRRGRGERVSDSSAQHASRWMKPLSSQYLLFLCKHLAGLMRTMSRGGRGNNILFPSLQKVTQKRKEKKPNF